MSLFMDILIVLFGLVSSYIWFMKFSQLEEKHAPSVDTLFKELAAKLIKFVVPFLFLHYIDVSIHFHHIMEFSNDTDID